MADGATQGVLGLKARVAQRAFEARGMSAGKALRRALARSADVLWDLALVAQSVEIDVLDQDGVVDALAAGDLLVVLDGPDNVLGLAAIDREVLTALVEVQTIQQVTQVPVDDRTLTATDAAMAAPFMDDVLKRFAANLDDNPLRAGLEGFRFGAMLEDKRAAANLLNAPAYQSFRTSVDLALGRRKGRIGFFLPQQASSPSQPTRSEPGRYEQTMKFLPVAIEATLARIALPLGTIEGLKPGDLLPLTPSVIDNVELRAGRSSVVAKGRIGQMNGMRAVRLNWPHIPATKTPLDASDVETPPAGSSPGSGATQTTALAAPEKPGLIVEADALPELPELPAPDTEIAEDFGDFETMDFDGLDFDAQITE